MTSSLQQETLTVDIKPVDHFDAIIIGAGIAGMY
jgi:hypothetical protein